MLGLMMDYPLTIDRILEHAYRMHPQKQITTKLPDGSMHRYTYADLYGRVKRLANVLGNLGVESGDRVGTFAWNSYQHLELYFAIPCRTAVCHTLNTRFSLEQLVYVVNHAEDKVVFIDAAVLPLFEQTANQINCVEHFILFNADSGLETNLTNVHFYEDLMAEAPEDYEWININENTAMGLCYTSGTTGDPKGVLYSHRSMFLHTMGISHANAFALNEQDVVMPAVPMYHAMAWGLPYACAYAGSDMVFPGQHLNPSNLAQLIVEEKVTVPAGVPALWSGMCRELKANPKDIAHIRALAVGGAAMPRSLIEAYEKELHVNVMQGWGMTETSPVGSLLNLQSHHTAISEHAQWDIKAKQGYALAGFEMRIVDEAGTRLPWDGVTMGELQVRGPWVARSYYKIERSPEHFTSDGWFRTGDVATISPDGCMQIVDRTKDLVKSGGEWISSVKLENALMGHPKVMEAAVIAIPDEQWSERPMAFVVLTPGAGEITAEELVAHLVSKFPKFWLPDTIAFVDEIPKTSVGKLDKKLLRHRYEDRPNR